MSDSLTPSIPAPQRLAPEPAPASPGRRLALMMGASVLLWVTFAMVMVPMVIRSAYEGQSWPFLNDLISGQAVHPVDHYLQVWGQIARAGLVACIAFWLLAIATSLEAFARRFVPNATPGSLGAIRMWTSLLLILSVFSEDLPSIARLPAEMRLHGGVLHFLYAMPLGLDRLVASASALHLFQWITIGLLVLATVGLWTRIMVPLAAFAVFLFLGILIDYTFFWHQGVVPLFVLTLLAFTRCGDGWSLDRLRSISRGDPVVPADVASRRYGWARYACWVVIVPGYALNGVSKFEEGGWYWWSATNFRGMLYMDNLNPRWFEWTPVLSLAHLPDAVFASIALVAVVMETLFVLVLFSHVARWIFPAFAMGMHVGIGTLQRFVFFDLVLLQFVFWDWTGARKAIARRLAATRGPVEVLYDGQCPLCQRTVRLLTALDLFGRLVCRDFRVTALDGYRAVGVTAADLEREMYVVQRGRTYAGFAAYRILALALPALWLLAPWLFLPGVASLGARVYGRIARDRRTLLCDGHCAPTAPAPADAHPPSRLDAGRRRLGFQLGIAGIVVVSMVCWTYKVEFYPLTSWHLYSYSDTSGQVKYLKVFARDESGRLAAARFEDTIGAIAYDGRYWDTLKRCFDGSPAAPWPWFTSRDPVDAARNMAICNKFLVAAAATYNEQASPGRAITQYQIETWMWDFLSNPTDPAYGHMLDRFTFDVHTATGLRDHAAIDARGQSPATR